MLKKNEILLRVVFVGFWSLSILLGVASGQEIVKIGVPQWTPFVEIKQGVARGPLINALSTVAERCGWELKIVPVESMRGIEKLKAGEIDILVEVSSGEKERDKGLIFTKPRFLLDWPLIFCPRSILGKGLVGLKRKTIAVLENDLVALNFLDELTRLEWDVKPIFVDEVDKLVGLYRENKVQVVMCDSFIGRQLQRSLGFNVRFFVGPISNIRFVALPYKIKLIDHLNNIIKTFSREDFERDFLKDFVEGVPVQGRDWIRWVPILFVVLLISSVVLFNQLSIKSEELYYKYEELKLEIKERIITEEKLRAERDFSRILIETVGAIVLVVDMHGIIVQANRTITQILGYEPEEVMGKFIWDIVSPPHYVFEKYNNSRRKDVLDKPQGFKISIPNCFESICISKNNIIKIIEWRNARLDRGASSNIICAGVDITERKKAEEELKKSEERYRNLFENLQQVFFRVNNEGNLMLISPFVKEFLGYSEEEIIGVSFPWNFLLRDEDIYRLRNFWENDGELVMHDEEIAFKTRKGEKVWGLLSMKKFYDADGEFVGCEGMIRDYSLQKQIQRAIEERAELEKGLKLAHAQMVLSQLNPHFLFNTLNLIARIANIEEAQQTEDVTIRFAKYLRYILRKQTREEFVTLNQELDSIRNLLTIFKKRFEERMDFIIISDDRSLKVRVPFMILQPIVENAVVHGVEGCSKKVTISICTRIENEKLLLTVKDDGMGFDTTNYVEGKGLFSVRERINYYYGVSGTIKINSELGKGTEIKISLPFVENFKLEEKLQ